MAETPETKSDTDGLPPTARRVGNAEVRTFLIADIRGYTQYTARSGAAAAGELASQFATIVREVVVIHDGSLIELRGDEALVVFVLAGQALRAAIELQARAAAELPLGIGIGLDAGEAVRVEGGYRGSALNLAARLCARATAGVTLASEAVIHLAGAVDGVGYDNGRTYRLKGMAAPVRAARVLGNGRGRSVPARYGRDTDRDRRLAIGGLTFAMAVTVAATVIAFESGVFESVPPAANLPVVEFIDPTTGKVTDSKPVQAPTGLSAFKGGSFWLRTRDPAALVEIDAKTHAQKRSIAFPMAKPGEVEITDDVIWVADGDAPRVIALDLATGAVRKELVLRLDADDTRQALAVAEGDGSIWISVDGEIFRLDATSGAEQARIDEVEADVLEFGEESLWFTGDGSIGRVDTSSNAVAFVTELGPGGGFGQAAADLPFITFAGNSAWTANDERGKVWRIDRTGRSTEFTVGFGARALTTLGDDVWAAVRDEGKLVSIDTATEQQRAIDIGHLVASVATDGEQLMVGVDRTPEERIGALSGNVLTIASPGNPLFNLDPPINRSFEGRQAEYATCAGLLRYEDAAAPDGWRLTPEVAAAMPEISTDGRNYTFTVRDGFKFSPPSNEPLTAETYRYSLERALAPQTDAFAAHWLDDIDGAEAFMSGTASSLAGVTASGQVLTIRLTAASGDFLDRITLPYFCPVPLGTPSARGGLNASPPIATAGPYYVSTNIDGRLVIFERNPNYGGEREGPWDSIAWRAGFSPGDVIARVEDGRAGAATGSPFDSLMNAQSDRAIRWGPGSDAANSGDQRWFGAPRFSTSILFLNPARLFADVNIRRAVALAIDRTDLAEWENQQPFGNLLAPSARGSVAADTPIAAPDLEAARALMAGRSGSVVMGYWAGCDFCEAEAESVAGQLAKIGITVDTQPRDDLANDARQPDSNLDLYGVSLDTEYSDPLTMLRNPLTNNDWIGAQNLAEFARLAPIGGEQRVAGAVDLARTLSDDEAYAIPYAYPIYPMYLGEHVGCGFVQPAIGAVDLLSLCPEP